MTTVSLIKLKSHAQCRLAQRRSQVVIVDDDVIAFEHECQHEVLRRPPREAREVYKRTTIRPHPLIATPALSLFSSFRSSPSIVDLPSLPLAAMARRPHEASISGGVRYVLYTLLHSPPSTLPVFVFVEGGLGETAPPPRRV